MLKNRSHESQFFGLGRFLFARAKKTVVHDSYF